MRAEWAATTLVEVNKAYLYVKIGLLSFPSTHSRAKLIIRKTNNNVAIIDGVDRIKKAINAIVNYLVLIATDTLIFHIARGVNKPIIAFYPKAKGVFNPWLSPTTYQIPVFFSAYVSEDINNYSIPTLILFISYRSK